MAGKIAAIRRERALAIESLDKALKRKQGKIGQARRQLVIATAEILRAELNHRRAAPLLHANARRQQIGDLFAQIGA
jgi:hypothetical protein